MARYLTPVKIGVLLLIEQYLNCQLASTARLKVLSLISSRIHGISGNDRSGGVDRIMRLDETAEKLFAPLIELPSDVPGRTVYDGLLQRLWNLDGLDDAYALFEMLTEMTAAPVTLPEAMQRPFTRASPMGQYVRRCCVEFTRLQFPDTQALWKAFVFWREPTRNLWAQRNPETAARQLDQQTSNVSRPMPSTQATLSGAEHFTSAEDATELMTFSLHHLQKFGTRIPDAMRDRLQTWLTGQHDAGVQSMQHFLAFFEHWKAGQYTMALESLHRYFDHSLGSRTSSGSDNVRIYYQFALLHLSVLHADFDCWEESVDAMDECIATARENQDTMCLTFALSWLLYLRQAKPDNRSSIFGSISGMLGGATGEQDEIAFLKARARDTKNWSLLTCTLLEEAKVDMHTSGIAPRSVEHIIQAAYVNLQHDLRNHMPATSLYEAAALDRLGQSHLVARTYDIVKDLYGEQAPLSERVRAVCRVSYNTAQSGRCSLGLRMLDEALSLVTGVLKLEQRVTGFVTLVQLLESLRRDDMHAALYYRAQLQPLRKLCDPEIDFEIDLLEVELYIKQLELEQALSAVNAHVKRMKRSSNADVAQRLHFLIMKARIFAASGLASKGFSICLRAASTAARLRLLPQLLDAISALANILNELSAFEAAKELLDAALPSMLESRQTKLVADSLVVLGESYVGLAAQACLPSSMEQTQKVRIAESYIERAREVYAKLGDIGGQLDCLAMASRLAQFRNDEQSAAQAEGLYAQLLTEKAERNSIA